MERKILEPGAQLKSVIDTEAIKCNIYLIRRQKVMLDSDLAGLYGVPTKVLVQAVKRNIKRFPIDFMFQLQNQEVASLRSQIVTTSFGHGGRRYRPYVFTEQGVAMLSTVLNSEMAIEVNIQIMRAFVKLREMIATHKDLAKKLEELEKKYDSQFRVVFDAIRALVSEPEPKQKKIGFLAKESKAIYRTNGYRVRVKERGTGCLSGA
jgi:phage regulator Rha-like protein